MGRNDDDDVIRFDFDVNMTLEVDGDTWRDLLEVCDGNEKEAMVRLEEEMEGDLADQQTISGRVWPCMVSKSLSVIEDFTKKEEKV